MLPQCDRTATPALAVTLLRFDGSRPSWSAGAVSALVGESLRPHEPLQRDGQHLLLLALPPPLEPHTNGARTP